MVPRLPLLLVVAALALSACSDAADDAPAAAGSPATPAATFSDQVRQTFLDACLDNATNTAGGAASEEQLRSTCACILGKVEQEYSEAEFAQFEERLLGGQASEQESGRLTTWSTDCAREATS